MMIILKKCEACLQDFIATRKDKRFCTKACRDRLRGKRRSQAAAKLNKKFMEAWLAQASHPARQEFLEHLYQRVAAGEFTSDERLALTAPFFFQEKNASTTSLPSDSFGLSDQRIYSNIAIMFDAFCRDRHGVASYIAFKTGHVPCNGVVEPKTSESAPCNIAFDKAQRDLASHPDHQESKENSTKVERPAWLNWDE